MTLPVIRGLQSHDLRAVTRIHLMAFPKSALGQFGKEAVRRYYEWQLYGPHDAVAYGIYQEDVLTGFCFAGVFSGALSGFLQKNKNFLIWRILTHPWLIFSPFFRERMNLARTLLKRRSVPADQKNSPSEKSFGILVIAVDPQMQHIGLGERLMTEIEKVAGARGFSRLNLTVDINNIRAVAFYQNLNWKKLAASDGIWRGSMIKYLADSCE